MVRTKVPAKTEAEVMFKSNLQCCVCKKRGDHIHHLDGNPNNNNFDNLALLCLKHHDLATIEKSLRKKLSKDTIIKYREHHYQVIETERQNSLDKFNRPIEQLTEEDLLTASKNAIIIIDIAKITHRFSAFDWKETDKIFDELCLYSEHSNPRIAYEIFGFLSLVASTTRAGMPSDTASYIHSMILTFLPYFGIDGKKEQVEEIGKLGLHIGKNIVYDAFKYLNNLNVAMWGLSIIKFIYRSAKEAKNSELMELVNKAYDWIEDNISHAKPPKLYNSQELVKAFRNDLEKWDLGFPELPPDLMKIIDAEKR